MTLLVIFVFGAMILGAGAMLAPALPTQQPRIALTGTLALALIVGGAVFWAMTFGWQVLVVDYILFAVIVGIFLSGALSFGQQRAEKQGEVLLDEEQGWTGPGDLLFFAVMALFFTLPVLLLQIPFGDNAQVEGYRALAAKIGGSFDTLVPFQPGVVYDAPPAFSALTAYLSQQIGTSLAFVQFAVAGVLALVLTWLVYDLGSEAQDKPLGRAFAAALLLTGSVFTAVVNGQYTSLLATLFAGAALTFVYRYLKYGKILDLVGAGLLAGAVLITDTTVLIVLAASYTLWLIVTLLGKNRPSPRQIAGMTLAVPLIAAAATAPYLVYISPPANALTLPAETFSAVTVYAVPVFLLAFMGAFQGIRDQEPLTYFALAWTAVVVLLNLIGQVLNGILLVLPLTILGGRGLYWAWREVLPPNRRAVLIAAAVIAFVVLTAAADRILTPEPRLTADQIATLEWMRANTPADARVLNQAADDWAAVLTEREVVYTPIFTTAAGAANSNADVQRQFIDFHAQPQESDNAEVLQNVDYVYLPMDRGEIDYLERVFESGTAQVYQVNSP